MQQGHRTVVWVIALLASMFVSPLAHAQPAPIADSFARHRAVLSCPDAGSTHDYEHCAFEFMRRVACDHQSDIALWPKNGGTFCTHEGRGYDCDKLVMRASGEMFDIVASAGIASQSPTWNRVATGVFGGTVPAPSCTASVPTMALGDAATQIFEAFQRTHERSPEQAEIDAMTAFARANGWDGGLRIPIATVNALVTHIRHYSGDLNNPFPTIHPIEALTRINDAFFARFGRYMRAVERSALDAQAESRGYVGGPMPLWVLKELLALIAVYDGLYGAHLAQPVAHDAQVSVLGPGFALNGARFQWRGITAFPLQYDYVFDRAQYNRFRDAAVWNKVSVVRIGVGVSSGYLTLTPQSGGTFGRGRTTPLFPGSPQWSWPAYRAMLADLNAHGLVPEVVPFLTTGPEDHDDPRMRTAAGRMAYLEEVARELLPVRAAVIEIANEYNQIGFPDDGLEIVALASRYKQLDPSRLVATSAYHPAVGDYATVHWIRDTRPYSFTWVLRQFSIPHLALGIPVVNDEGINADTVGEFGADSDPRNHFINGVTTQLLKMSYTFHFDRGLKGLEPSTVDGSQQAFEAWRAGLDLVDFDLPGQLYQASPAGATPGFPFLSLGGAVAAAGRADDSRGVFVFYGAPSGFVVPAAPGWSVELLADVQTHKVFRLTRIVQ